MQDDFSLILESLKNSWSQVAWIVPRFLVAAILLIAGWLLARGVQRLAVRVMRLLRVDRAAEQTGVDDFLLRGGVRFTVVTLVGQVLYWSILLIITVAVFNVLGLTVGPRLVEQLASHAPDVGGALVVVVVGSLGARFLRGVVETYLGNVGVKEGAAIGVLVHGALLAFVAILALEQLGVAINLLASVFQLAFGGLCLALALAFGLGGRGWAEALLERAWSRR